MTFLSQLERSFPCISFIAHLSADSTVEFRRILISRGWILCHETQAVQITVSQQLLLEGKDFEVQKTFSSSLHLFENYTGNLLCQITLASLCLALCVDKLTDISGAIFNILR